MRAKKTRIEIIRLCFFFAVLITVAAILIYLPRITIPIGIAFILHMIFGPLVPRLTKMGVKREFSIWIIFVGVLFFSIYPVVKMAPIITTESQNFQYYIPKVERYIETETQTLRAKIKKKIGYQVEQKHISEGVNYIRTTTANFLLNLPKSIANIIEWVFVVPLFFFFMLKDGEKLHAMLLRIAPNNIFERFYYLSHQFNKKLGNYIFAKVVEALIVGVVITLGLMLLNVRFALLFGLIAGLTNVIPYLGPILGMVPALIFGMVDYGMGTTFGAMCILYIIANAIDIALVFPILVSKIVDLHPIVVVLSVIIGSQAFGILGMIISIPLAAALKLIFIEVYNEIYLTRFK